MAQTTIPLFCYMARNKTYSDAMREIRRLERASRRVEKRGYSFNLPFRFTSGGTMRTEYTAEDVEFLSGLRTKDLYQYAEFITPEGETLSGEEGRFYERSQTAKKAAQTRKERRSEFISREYIDNFLDFSQYIHYTKEYEQMVREYINAKIAIYGENATAFVLQFATAEGLLQEVQQSYDFMFQRIMPRIDKLFDKYGMEYRSWIRDFEAQRRLTEEEDVEDWDEMEDEEFESIFGR